MCCTPQISLNNKQPKKRLIVLVVLLCFIVVSILSEVFILTHADHEHDHDGAHGSCAVCAQIQSAESLLKRLGTFAISAVFLFGGLLAAIAVMRSAFCAIILLSPVALKIRMNN